MKTTRNMCLPLLALVAIALITADARAGRGRGWAEVEAHPAYVADPGIIDFADDSTSIIEVTMRGPLLRAGARVLERAEPELASLVRDLVAVNAVVLEDWDGSHRTARRAMLEIAEDLDDSWERIVRIRQKDEFILVYLHLTPDDEIDGLLVLMHDDTQLVFSNLVGVIDLERMADLADHMEIPGLEYVPNSRDPIDVLDEAGGEA